MSSSLLRICLVQFDIAWENPEENMRRIEKLLGSADGLDLVVLPEMWSTGFTMHPEIAAESPSGPALHWMIDQAKRRNAVIAGSISVADGTGFYNRLYCAFPDGQVSHYNKKHLFSYGKEDLHYTAGHERLILEIKGWAVMPVICYDLRFPVWCRNTDGYDLMLIVANWPIPRIHHWDTLLKARAIENQTYVAAVNRIGTDGNGLQYNGHSILLDMNGHTVISLDEKEGIAIHELDKQVLAAYREQFRFLQDKDQFYL